MASINKVIIVGRLGQDPEVRQFQNGGSLTTINVATSERWTDKNSGEQKEQTEWHRISMFNRLGEIAAQYLRKGALVYIEGSLHTRKYTDSQGIERYSTEVRASQMQMLDRRDNNGGQGGTWGNGDLNNNRQNQHNQQPFNNQHNNYHNQGYQGGFDNGNFGGGNQNHQGYQGNNFNNQFQSQNGFNQPYQGQQAPNYPNNNPNQGFGQPINPNAHQSSMNQGSEQASGQSAMQEGNAFMNNDKSAPKAVTPPSASGVQDDDMPF